MDRWAIIRRRAAELLSEYEARAECSAFDEHDGSHAHLEDIARRVYQFSVVPDDELTEELSGCLDPADRLIAYRPNEDVARQRFTIAHELGHHALGHPLRTFEDRTDQIDDAPHVAALTVKGGVYRAYSDRDRWELEANVFAAELLMPVERVRAMVLGDPRWSVRRLARYFGVTRSAMLNQLTAALLPGPSALTAASETSATLDPSQRRAAVSERPTLVLAGPGAGKTRVLVERFRHLVRDRGVRPDRILALTFANKAAEEMRERLGALLPAEAHAITVGTFHSLGLQLLQAYGHYLGLKEGSTPITEVDAFVLLRRRLGEVPLGSFDDLHRPSRSLGLLLKTISRAKDELCGPEAFARLTDEWRAELDGRPEPTTEAEAEALADERRRAAACADVAAVYATYQRWLREGGHLDYGDLIAEAVRLFDLPDVARDIRGQWDHVLVDEFQDINYASGRLVHALDGGRGIVWAVGDPRQSIYRFRGASPVNLLDFTSDYKDAEIIPLEWNYRSVEDIVRAGQAVEIALPLGSDGSPLPLPDLRSDRGRPTTEPAVELVLAATATDELAELVRRVRAEAEIRPRGHIAVLCRRRSEAQQVSEALEAADVPTDWGGALQDRSVFKDVLGALLLAADSPLGLLRLARLPEYRLAEDDLRRLIQAARERGDSALAALIAASDGEVAELSAESLAHIGRLKSVAGALRRAATPSLALATYLFERAGWLREFLHDDTPTGMRRRATLGQVADVAREFGGRPALAGDDMAAFIEFVRICLESGDLGASDEVLTASDVVHVLTVHRSKGLEWPVVLVPNLAEGRFPLAERDSLPLPPCLVHGAVGDENVEESCLFYVATTRARDRLILSRAEKYGRGTAVAAPFLRPLVEALEPPGYLRSRRAGPFEEPPASAPSSIAPSTFAREIPVAALEAYQQCGQRAKYEYVYGLRGDERGYGRFHGAVYATLAWIASEATNGSPPGVEAALAELARHWEGSGLDDHWFEKGYRRRAQGIVREFATRSQAGSRVAVRHHAVLRIGDGERAVVVTVDEVEVRGGRHIYRRHHFGPPAKSHRDRDDRLPLYAALHQQLHGDAPYEIRLHYPFHEADTLVSPTAKVVSNHQTKMARLIHAIEAGQFEPKPSRERCPHCPFNLICPA